MYMHDDSESELDGFDIELTDGKHTLQRHVCVRVLPINDEEPHIIRSDSPNTHQHTSQHTETERKRKRGRGRETGRDRDICRQTDRQREGGREW